MQMRLAGCSALSLRVAPLEADPERLKNDSVSRFKRLRSAVLRRCFAKASVRREVA